MLHGRNMDVQCQLPILRRFRDWNFELLKISSRMAQLALDGRAEDPQLLWISRSTSKSRYMVDEASRFEMLGVSLGMSVCWKRPLGSARDRRPGLLGACSYYALRRRALAI